MESVSQLVTNARPLMPQELVPHAMMATTTTMEFVSSHPLRNLQTKDVAFGTGKTRNVLNAQTTGSSTDSDNASLSQTNARPSTHQVPVPHAMMDTT